MNVDIMQPLVTSAMTCHSYLTMQNFLGHEHVVVSAGCYISALSRGLGHKKLELASSSHPKPFCTLCLQLYLFLR